MVTVSTFLVWIETRTRSAIPGKKMNRSFYTITEAEILSDRWVECMEHFRKKAPHTYRNMRKLRDYLEGKRPTCQIIGPSFTRESDPLDDDVIRAYYGLKPNQGGVHTVPMWWLFYNSRLPIPIFDLVFDFERHWGRLWKGGYFSPRMLTRMIVYTPFMSHRIMAAEQLVCQPFHGDDEIDLYEMVEPLRESSATWEKTKESKRFLHLLTNLALKYKRPMIHELLFLLMQTPTPKKDRLRIAKRLYCNPNRDDLWVLSQYGPFPYRTWAAKRLKRRKRRKSPDS